MLFTLFRHLQIATALTLAITVLALTVPVEQVFAGGLGGRPATEGTVKISAIKNTITAASSGVTATGVTSLVTKEALDGIAWQIAKQMVSSMTKSLVNWINSGFQGSPAFITDLNGFLLDALDTAAGEFIKSLGGIGEFICSPFKLDVQAALSINYAQARSGMPSGPTAPACKLSDIKNNIEGFLTGVGDAGWEDWLSVTSNPQNTPYGAYLEAEAKLNIKLKNEAGQEKEILDWGQGFLSKRVCEAVEGKPTGKGKNCKITTPGQVISEALTFQLSTGPRSLIEADEINEIIGALINQLSLQAMQGINGLLGLGGNSSYTDNSFDGGSYLDAALNEQMGNDTTALKGQIDTALINEQNFLNIINKTLLEASSSLAAQGYTTTGGARVATSTATDSSQNATVAELVQVYSEASVARPQVELNIANLTLLIAKYNNASSTAIKTATTTKAQAATKIRQQVILEYVDLVASGKLSSAAIVETKKIEWGSLFR